MKKRLLTLALLPALASAQTVVIEPGSQVLKYDDDNSVTLHSADTIQSGATLMRLFPERTSQYEVTYGYYVISEPRTELQVLVPEGKTFAAYFDLMSGVESATVCLSRSEDIKQPAHVVPGRCR